ncbi:MAG: hypothetical protein ACK5DG_11410 [Chitinophagaceae bacterium]|jgi:hypothetical protein
MASYSIPVYFEHFERQKKAARLIHFLAGFLMIANAWGDFNQPTPDLIFVVVQVAGALLCILFAFAGKKVFPQSKNTNQVFRLIETLLFAYAAWYFFTKMNLTLMGFLQVLAAIGLLMLFITERKIFSATNIRIDDKGIHTPNNLADRFIAWNEIENMLIKNDFISINTIKNQFIQYETNIILSELEMDEMNAFCREQFTKA